MVWSHTFQLSFSWLALSIFKISNVFISHRRALKNMTHYQIFSRSFTFHRTFSRLKTKLWRCQVLHLRSRFSYLSTPKVVVNSVENSFLPTVLFSTTSRSKPYTINLLNCIKTRFIIRWFRKIHKTLVSQIR